MVFLVNSLQYLKTGFLSFFSVAQNMVALKKQNELQYSSIRKELYYSYYNCCLTAFNVNDEYMEVAQYLLYGPIIMTNSIWLQVPTWFLLLLLFPKEIMWRFESNGRVN